jgi:transposase-like protein
LGERLWEDYQAFAQCHLSEYEITHLFVDGIAERLRPGGKREPVLAAWGFTIGGRRVLLHMMAGSKEDAETVTAFLDMKGRDLKDPSNCRRISGQSSRCARRRIRRQAGPLRASSRPASLPIMAAKYDNAVACFMDNFEACIAHLRFPVTHRRAIRTTTLFERLFVEERRRLKIIPNAFGGEPS